VNPQAARFGDLTITQRDLEQDVKAFLADKDIRAQLSQPGQTGTALIPPQADGSVVSMGLEGYVLRNEADFQAIHQLAKQQGITGLAPAADADVIAAVVPTGFEALWTHFSPALRNRWAVGLAEQQALITKLAGPVPDEATQRAFYETVKDQANGATFEQAQAQIIQILQRQPVTDALTAVKKDMVVVIDPKYGSWGARGYEPLAVPITETGATTTTP
jgi:hypothetical protein